MAISAVSEWDDAADVVVVGYGAAGVSAALEARASGVQVLALDRYNGGGATALSGGVVYAGGGTAVQAEAGVADTVDAMFDYLCMEVGDAVRPETLRRFCEQSPAMIDWLAGNGVPFEASLCPYKTSYPSNKHYLYYSGSEAAGQFRAVAPPAPRGHRAKGRGTSGKVLFGPLARSAAEKGIEFRPQTRVTGLITGTDGRVTGVQADTLRYAPARVRRAFTRMAAISAKPGIYHPGLRRSLQRRLDHIEAKYVTTVRIQARKGVILTAGDDGSGIGLGVAVGAATDKMGNISAWRFITPPSAFLSALAVDSHGDRMVDESRYGAALGDAMIKRHDSKGWLLIDAELERQARTQLGEQTVWFQRMQTEGLLRTGRTTAMSIEELADQAGIEPAGLRATVDAHNEAIATDKPDPMGKHTDFTRPIVTAPFSLLDISIKPSLTFPTPMLTLGGLVVDEETGVVQSPAGEGIPGLYAAGRTAVGICSNSYVSGLSIADCIFSGRRAGGHSTRSGSSAAA